MDAKLILKMIELLIEKGVPAFIEWNDGTQIENPTVEDFEALKVKKMRDKE